MPVLHSLRNHSLRKNASFAKIDNNDNMQIKKAHSKASCKSPMSKMLKFAQKRSGSFGSFCFHKKKASTLSSTNLEKKMNELEIHNPSSPRISRVLSFEGDASFCASTQVQTDDNISICPPTEYSEGIRESLDYYTLEHMKFGVPETKRSHLMKRRATI